MSHIINELAKIEISNDVLQQLNVAGIYRSFKENYRKLDNLKNFKTDYEKQNRLTQWWHNDKLRDAQLDSAEVQAEFSKAIGQLLMISIMQSKRLSEQQTQLNDQQGKLKAQADGIAVHAGKLQQQQQVLAEQSQKLETLVHEYFELKGLTEDGAQQLIEVALQVKATKAQMIQEFISRANGVEALCTEVQTRTTAHIAQVDERIRLTAEKTQADLANVQRDTLEALVIHENRLRSDQEAAQNSLNQRLDKLTQSQHQAEAELQAKHAALESWTFNFEDKHEQLLATHQEKLSAINSAVGNLSTQSTELDTAIAGMRGDFYKIFEQQKIYQEAFSEFKKEVSKGFKKIHFFATGLSTTIAGILGAIVYAIKYTPD